MSSPALASRAAGIHLFVEHRMQYVFELLSILQLLVCVPIPLKGFCVWLFCFGFSSVCAGPHICVAICGAVAKAHCETAALVH